MLRTHHVICRFIGIVCLTNWLMLGCSTEGLHSRVETTERAMQPTVTAFECGGGSVKAAIASCRAQGGNYGHCALAATHEGAYDATACYTYANEVRARRQQLIGQEDLLDAQIRYLHDVNIDTAKLNAELRAKVEEATARSDTATDSLAQGQMTAAELTQLRAILDREIFSAQRQLDAASNELQAAQQYRSRSPPSASALDAEIFRLQALLAESKRQTSALVAQRQRF